jgi:hypothetical protein
MTALVIAEHDHASIKPATLNTVTAAWQCGGDVHVLVAGANAAEAAKAAAQIAGVDQGHRTPTARASRERPGRERRRSGAGHRQQLQPHPVPLHRQRQERRAARGRQARRGADLRHHQGRQPRHLRAPDLRRQRDRHRAKQRCHQGDHRAHDRLRCRSRHRWQRHGRNGRRRRRQRQEQLRGPRSHQERTPRTDRRQDHRLRWPRARLRREVHRSDGAAGRQAQRGPGRQPRRRRCGLRTERLASGPDRQDRRAAAVHRSGHLGRDPALGRHEGLQGDRRDQQGRGSADLQRGRLRPGPTCSRPCPSWSRRSEANRRIEPEGIVRDALFVSAVSGDKT